MAWSEEKGLPLSQFAYWLEDHGIPSLPALALLIVVVIALLALAVFPSLGVGAPRVGSVVVRVIDVSGLPAENVSVTVTASEGEFTETRATASDGSARFEKIPEGLITVTARSNAFFFEDGGRIEEKIERGKEKIVSFTATPLEINLVSLYVEVEGVDNANIYLFDSSGVQLQQDFGYRTEFHVTPNANYLVRAALAGYSPVEENVSVGEQSATVKLRLTRAGEVEKTLLHVGVFDYEGIEGNPIVNASVTVVEKTSSRVAARLTTGEDGTADASEVPRGAVLEISASAPGFLSESKNVNASTDVVNVKLRLRKAGVDASSVTLRVVDQFGDAISSPIVRFYERGAFKQEFIPIDGIASINSTSLETLYATAFKPGFLPAIAKTLKRGENKLALALASENNSGIVRVHVTNKNGVPESEAFVTLLDAENAEKRFLGIPPRVTGIDGLQQFDGVPAGTRLIAVASKNARSASSNVFETPPGAGGVDVEIVFQPVKTKLEASVRNALNNAPVLNARVFVSTEDANASCVTNALGKCVVEVFESDAAIARVTASGFDDFESAFFSLAPNALNSREFALTPVGPAAGQITFTGFFDARGKRVNSLKPLSTYSAKFVLRSLETEFKQARAHVRVGALETPLSEENAVITGYSSATSSVTRGVSYEETLAAAAAAAGAGAVGASNASIPELKGHALIELGDYGFSPPDVEVVLGDEIVFQNNANATRVIVFDKQFKGAPAALTLSAGKTASLTPSETGSFAFREATNPEFVGTLNVAPKPVEEVEGAAVNGAQAREFKWVEFAFEKFRGSREIVVFFKTKNRVDGSVRFEYRAAFLAQFGNETLTLRDPKDDEASKTKPEALALAKKTSEIPIKFVGECSDPQAEGGESVCLQSSFAGEGVKSASGFDARYGGSFKIVFKTLKESTKTIFLRASTDSRALELVQGALGGVKLFTPKNYPQTLNYQQTPALKTLALKTLALETLAPTREQKTTKMFLREPTLQLVATPTPAHPSPPSPAPALPTASAGRVAEEGVQEATVAIKASEANGFFEFNARRLSKDSIVTLSAFDDKNNLLLETRVSIRVIASSMPSLKVRVRPTTVTALEDNTVFFTVTDQFGAPVENARVTLESPLLAASVEASAEEARAARGEYAASGVNPLGVGVIDYRVEAEGYRVARGRIAVNPPSTVLEVTPTKISLSVESREQPVVESLNVENKLSNALRVAASVALARQPNLVDVSLTPSTLSLKTRELKQISLSAAIKDAVLQIAEKTRVQSERVTGRVVLSTRVGSFSETREIPLEVNAVVEQQSLEELWSVDQSSLEFQLNADDKRSETLSISVSNNAPYPLLLNQENSLDGTSVEPLSQVIEPNSQTQFSVTTRFTSTEECVFFDSTSKGTLVLHASYAGLTSKKTVALSRTVKASGKCVPPNGFRVTLPLSLTIPLPANALVKNNVDGSTTVKLATQELMQFDAGASVSPAQAVVPLNTFMTLDRKRVTQPSSGSVTITFPTQTQYVIPADASVIQQGALIEVRAGSFIAFFPPGTQLSLGGWPGVGAGVGAAFLGSSGYYDYGVGGSSVYVGGGGLAKIALVPPEAPVRFERFTALEEFTRLLGLMPPGGIEVRFPVEMFFVLPPGTRVERIEAVAQLPVPPQFQQLSNLQGFQIALLPNFERIAFGPEAVIAPLPGFGLANALIARVPIETSVVFMPRYVRVGSIDLTLPTQAALVAPQSASFKRSRAAGREAGAEAGVEYLMESPNAIVKFFREPTLETKTIQGRELKTASLSQGERIVFLKGAEAKTALAEVEDPFEVLSCSISFIATEDVRVDLPFDAIVSEKQNAVTASVQKCSSDSRFTVKSASNGETLFESPASKKIIAQNAVVEGAVEEGRVAGEGASLQIPKGSKIDFRPCAKTSEDSKKTMLVLSSPSTLELPANAVLNGVNELVLPGKTLVKIIDENGKTYSLSSTERISLDYSKTGFSADDVQKMQEPLKQGEKPKKLITPAKTALRFQAYCDGTTDGQIKVQSDSNTLTFEPNSVEFNLDNNKLSEEKLVYLGNSGETPIQVTGLELDTLSGDPKLAAQALPVEDSTKFNFRVGYGVGERTLTRYTEKALFFLTAQVPPNALKQGSRCIKDEYKDKPLEINAVINFKSKDLSTNTELNPKKLYVKLVISAKEECGQEKFEKTASFLYTAFANKQTLSFKRRDHWRIITLANNWREPIIIQASDAKKLIECKALESPEFEEGAPKSLGKFLSGYRLEPGAAKTFACKSLREGESQLDLKFKIENSENTIPANPIPIRVFNGDENLYSSSPFGEILSSEKTTEETRAPECVENYCLLQTATKALEVFASTAIALAREELKDPTLFKEWKSSAGEKQWQKVMILQLANTRLEADAVQKIFETLKNLEEEGVKVEKEGESSLKQQLKGCGTYALVFRLNLGEATTSNDLTKATLDLQRVIKQADCPETPANAPLLLGGELDKIEFFAGKRVVSGFGFFKELLNVKEHSQGGFLGMISTGPYGGREGELDEKDLANLQGMASTVYSIQDLSAQNVFDSTRYEDSNFCWTYGKIRISAAAGSVLGSTTLQAFLGLGSGGTTWATALKSLLNLFYGGAGCLGSLTASTPCSMVSECIQSLIASAFLPISGSKEITGLKEITKTEVFGSLGATAVLSALGNYYSEKEDAKAASLYPPLAVQVGANTQKLFVKKKTVTQAVQQASITQKISRFSGKVGALGIGMTKFAFLAEAASVFNTDVRPVNAVAYPDAIGYVISYHLDEDGLPSIYRFCYPNPSKQAGGDACVEDQSFYLANACDSTNYACVLLRKLSDSKTGIGKYALLIPINAESVDAKKLFASIFMPDEQPISLGGKGTSKILTNEDVSKLRNREAGEDKGNGAAFQAKKISGPVRGRVIRKTTGASAAPAGKTR